MSLKTLRPVDLARVCGGDGPYRHPALTQGNQLYQESLGETDAARKAVLQWRSFQEYQTGYRQWKREGRPGWLEIEPRIESMEDPRFHALG